MRRTYIIKNKNYLPIFTFARLKVNIMVDLLLVSQYIRYILTTDSQIWLANGDQAINNCTDYWCKVYSLLSVSLISIQIIWTRKLRKSVIKKKINKKSG